MSLDADYFLPDSSAYPQIKIGGKDVDLQELLTLDVNNLVDDYRTVVHWITTIAYKLEAMEARETEKRRELARVEAEVMLDLRRTTDGKPTEATIKAMMTLDDRVIAAQKALDGAVHQTGVFKVVLRAIEGKRDMLINLGAELRNKKSR